MTKGKKIIYWVATIWLALGMLSSGIVQLLNMKEGTEFITRLGYPSYFVTLLGISKILGVVVLLIPKFPLLKEWAYAGFFFTMSGAVFSHFANSGSAKDFFGPVLLLILIIISWYSRPADRKVILPNNNATI